MVLGVCRRLLGNSHDAEDAFQATFLVLVRKAASIRPAGMVGNWLYGVAHRTALEARRSAARRRAKEAQVAPRTEAPEDTLAHLRPLLDQELPRLPDKYRAVLVLCDLEGRTRKEAAQQLGLPEGTTASRLSRARTILAKRLTRQGVALSGGTLAAVLAQEAVSASAPPSLVVGTVKAAMAFAAGPAATAALVSAPVAALTEGVLKTMLLRKLNVIGLLLVMMGVVGTGLGSVSFRVVADDQPAVQSRQQQAARADGKQSETVPPEQKKGDGRAKAKADETRASETNQAKEVVDRVLKGYQAYWDSKGTKPASQDLAQFLWETMEQSYRPRDGKKTTPAEKEALDAYKQAFLTAFQLSSAIAKGQVAPDDKRPADLTNFLWEMMEKSYRPPDGKKAGPADKEALDQYKGAFLKAFQIASEIARASGKKAPQETASADQHQAKQVLELLRKGLEAYQADKRKGAARADKEALDLYAEAFLKAFQMSSEMAKAKGKHEAKLRPDDQAVLDSCGPAFLQAYERARTLRNALEHQKAPDDKRGEKALEALDVFLKAGQEFEQAVKHHAKTQAVQQARREIESALSKVEASTRDRRTALEALEEIERVVRQLKKDLQKGAKGK
jgi:RNA polymerase sigma factor (sigma-70 family)